MIIRKLRLETFGGVQNRDVSFSPGLNVVLGPNEAGKSTMVNALFAALFLPADVKKQTKEWKDYLVRFLPVGGGDTIAVTVEFTCREGKCYTLSRSWGVSRACRLVVDGGGVITSEETVQQRLAEILGHGRGTYEGVLFARQEEMIKTVELLRSNAEAANTLGDALRAALFEAGGVSLDELAAAIEEAKKDLLHYWDVEMDGPKGNRGIDRPWKNGGRLLEAYYEVEQLKRDLRAAREAEERMDAAMSRLEAAIREKTTLEPQVLRLQLLDGEIRKRSLVEAELLKAAAREEKLKEINTEWPKVTERLLQLQKQETADKQRLAALTAEWQEAEAAAKARTIRELYRQALPLADELGAVENEMAGLPEVSGQDIGWLNDCLETVARREVQLQAMKLTGKISVEKPLRVTVVSGLEREETVDVTATATLAGEGRLRISAVGWSLEVQAGQDDVDQILTEIGSLQSGVAKKLATLGFDSMAGARETLEIKNSLAARAATIQARLDGLLGDKWTFAQLRDTVAALPAEAQTRAADVVLAEKIQLEAKLDGLAGEVERLQIQVTQWEQAYGSYDAVMDGLADLRGEAKALRMQLAGLAELPEAYQSSEDFFAALDRSKVRLSELENDIRVQKNEIADVQRQAPEDTAEELAEAKQEAENRLTRLQREKEALLQVQEEFERLLEQIDSNTFAPFVKAFARYLAPATANRYRAADLDRALPASIVACDGRELPVEYLSTGTTRGVALALRLAMAEFLLDGAKGFMVMDDPLVDLDPQRKEQAAAIVREYAAERQMIITTCDPETARLLMDKGTGVLSTSLLKLNLSLGTEDHL